MFEAVKILGDVHDCMNPRFVLNFDFFSLLA